MANGKQHVKKQTCARDSSSIMGPDYIKICTVLILNLTKSRTKILSHFVLGQHKEGNKIK